MVQQKTIDEDPAFVEAFVRAIYRAQVYVKTASDADVAKAMLPFFPDTEQATLELVAKSYRATDSWTDIPTMTEDAFTRLQDVMDGAGVLSARVDFSTLVDNSFGEKAMSELK
jgi:NitT/TauT family transport system substrate-binding protein